MEEAKEVCIVIPTLNEEGSIGDTIESILDLDLAGCHIIVVDDRSADGTCDAVDRLREKNTNIRLVRRTDPRSFSRSYREGFEEAFSLGADIVVQMDADGSHVAADLRTMLPALGNKDCAVGSRYCSGGKIEGWSLERRSVSRFGNWYASFLLRSPLRDMTSGFVAWRASALRSIQPHWGEIRGNGYVFQIWLKYLAERSGLRIEEIPITFVERKEGYSKYRSSIMFEAAVEVVRMRFLK